MLNKDEIREKLDHWVPESTIHQLWRAIMKFDTDENRVFDTMVGDAWLAPSRQEWLIVMFQYGYGQIFDYFDGALADRYGQSSSNDVWDMASIAGDAYETWFMDQYRFLMDLE